jgi:hypothetical protein
MFILLIIVVFFLICILPVFLVWKHLKKQNNKSYDYSKEIIKEIKSKWWNYDKFFISYISNDCYAMWPYI